MRLRGLLLVAFAVASLFLVAVGRSEDAKTGEKKNEDPPRGKDLLELSLSSDKKEYAKGERPVFKVALKNISKSDLRVVGALDGSCRARRQPSLVATATLDGKPVEEDEVGLCGVMNPLTAADVKKLKPGESFDPFAAPFFSHSRLARTFRFDKAGTYKVSLVYDSEGADEKFHGTGEPKADALALLAKAARTKVTSNELTFLIK